MTMNLDNAAFFKSWLRALNRKQLLALDDWQGERLSGKPSKDLVIRTIEKKRLIYQEIRRRRDT